MCKTYSSRATKKKKKSISSPTKHATCEHVLRQDVMALSVAAIIATGCGGFFHNCRWGLTQFLCVCLCFICLVSLGWLVSVDQWRRRQSVCAQVSRPHQDAVICVYSGDTHIKQNASSVRSRHHPRCCTTVEFRYLLFYCVCVSAFDVLSARKFTTPCHSSSSNLLMCHSETRVMNKHADVQRDECCSEMR